MINRTGSRLSNRKRQVWVGVIAVLFVGDFVLCGYIPSRQRLKSLEDAKGQQRRTIEMAAAQGEELSGLKQKLANMQRIVESFHTYVPAESALGTFLEQIAGIMTECQLTDQVVLPGKEWETSSVSGIPIHITCKGTLTSLFDFFSRLEALDRLIRIEKVTLVNDNNLTGLISMQTEAVIFYQSPKQRKASGAAAPEAAGGSNNGT